MRDNRRVYRTIRMALKQMYPPEPKGNLAQIRELVFIIDGSEVGHGWFTLLEPKSVR